MDYPKHTKDLRGSEILELPRKVNGIVLERSQYM